MTYCVAMRLKKGLIFASDSRTNAGVDHVSVFSKTHRFYNKGERQIVILNAGNLASTQEIVNRLRQDIHRGVEQNMMNVSSLFDAALLLGEKVRDVLARVKKDHENVDFSCTFLIGGHIRGEEPRLFLVYPEGNFIEATEETPFFQIGESKYGKPIFDRVIRYDSSIEDSLKCTLISFDSTMRSNLSVGLPIDVTLLNTGDLENDSEYKVTEYDAFFLQLRQKWGEGLRNLFSELPEVPWIRPEELD